VTGGTLLVARRKRQTNRGVQKRASG
jgi:hypothetical protein